MGFHCVFLSLPILPGRDPDSLQLLQLVGSTSLSSQAARGCLFWVWGFLSFLGECQASFFCFCVLELHFRVLSAAKYKNPNGFFAAIPEEIFLWPFDLMNSAGDQKKKKRSRIYIENEQQESTTTTFSFFVGGLCFVPWVIEKCWPGFLI